MRGIVYPSLGLYVSSLDPHLGSSPHLAPYPIEFGSLLNRGSGAARATLVPPSKTRQPSFAISHSHAPNHPYIIIPPPLQGHLVNSITLNNIGNPVDTCQTNKPIPATFAQT